MAVSAVICGFFAYYSFLWLQSIGRPETAIDGFQYHSQILWPAILVSSLVLFALSTSILWTKRSAWAVWLTFFYFAIWIVVKYFFLYNQLIAFQTNNGYDVGRMLFDKFIGIALIVIAFIIAFSLHFLVEKLHLAMYRPKTSTETPIESEEDPIGVSDLSDR